MARDDPPHTPSGPGPEAPAVPTGDPVLAAIAHRLRARSERQQLLTERLRSGELRPGALADLAELAAAARRGARDGDHILVLAGSPRGPRLAAPPTPLGQALNTVVAASEAASRTVVPPTPSVSVDATAETVLGQILAELLAHAAGSTSPGERIELLTRWGPDGGIVVELQGTQPPRHRTPVDELDRALGSATPGGPVAPQEIGLHVAARLARAIGARLGVRAPAGNTAVAPIAVLYLPSSVVGGGSRPEPAPAEPAPAAAPEVPASDAAGATAALRRPAADGAPAAPAPAPDAPWPPRSEPRESPAPERSWPPAAAASEEPSGPGGLPRRGAPAAGGIAAAVPFAASGAPGPAFTAGPGGTGGPGASGNGPSGNGPSGNGPSGNGSGLPGNGPFGGGLPGTTPPGSGPSGNGVPGTGPPGAGVPGNGTGPSAPGPSGSPQGPGRNGVPQPSPAAEEPPVTEALPVAGVGGTTPPVELFGPFDSEVPVPVDDVDDTPIFAAVASAWFREPGSTETTALPVTPGGTAGNWRTPGDAEFDAARIRADRVVDLPTTAQGLPQRLPGQAMVPPSWRDTPNGAVPGGSRERQPDRVRNRLASYQRGLREGRHRAAEDHGPVNGVAVNGHRNGHHLDDGDDRSVG
ncbi:hypothetical protein [Pseudonocardia spirodelae]|uniref:Histidine kinase/HSP90-like ATPase domain-containing protein n=1 Tax=Pseudonocardia spirodelae TaxID=3133431 RepID=A0ABU8T1S2_9PSEU